jgi:hypothetical protein
MASRRRAFGFDLAESAAVGFEPSRLPGPLLETTNRGVDIQGIDLDPPRSPSDLMCRDEG